LETVTMWKTGMEWLKWLAAAFPQVPAASMKTDRFEIKGATDGAVIRMLQALKHYEDKPRRSVRGLGGRRRGTRSAQHSERTDRRP
jgi:hypothetical protein